jgi:hypothetical protein
MKYFSLHSAHLLLSLVATCFLLSSLIVMRRKSIATGSAAGWTSLVAKMTIWVRTFRLPAALWTGFAGLWARKDQITVVSAKGLPVEHHGD